MQTKLNFYFATLSILSGLNFIGVSQLPTLPVIAVFFSAFGFVFVDWLRWFALPPVMAYLTLGAIALYTLHRFSSIGNTQPEPQMIVVAELLVFVQSVLMLQIKSRRIYEQLAVFALLELIVAAIFNNALMYGLLLLPLGLVLVSALSLLSAYSTAELQFHDRALDEEGRIQFSSEQSQSSFASTASSLPRASTMVLVPAAMVVGSVFFYGLPRTNRQPQAGFAGKAQVGFSSQVQLGQIGKMMQNPEIAARVDLVQQETGKRYEVPIGFYLKGAVMEVYQTRQNPGVWSSDKLVEDNFKPISLPAKAESEETLGNYDPVVAKIQLAPMEHGALFSLPPYQFNASGPDLVHIEDLWVLVRSKKPAANRDSQINYRFSSDAFHNGEQRRFVPRYLPQPRVDKTSEAGSLATLSVAEMDRQRNSKLYADRCLQYDADVVPSVESLAHDVVARLSQQQRQNPVLVAEELERFLATNKRFKYTLDLTRTQLIGVDPVEQFLSIDRQGNCQFFASALVLMLRSQKIPARLVVGFYTDEYNPVGGNYIARQLHAHAWVEALVDARWLRPKDLYSASAPISQYWMRLDPSSSNMNNFDGGVDEVMNLAQEIWTSYVVEADANDRRRLASVQGISGTYEMYYEWLKLKVSRIRAGELGAGAFADGKVFSWTSAVAGILVALIGLFIYQMTFGRMFGRPSTVITASVPATPLIPFFAEAVSLLERLGIKRHTGQTAAEYTTQAMSQLSLAAAPGEERPLPLPLGQLANVFYEQRFAMTSFHSATGLSASDQQTIEATLVSLRQRVEQQELSAESSRKPGESA